MVETVKTRVSQSRGCGFNSRWGHQLFFKEGNNMVWYEIVFRFGLAVLFGALIGLERERKNRPAGVKTHILVCLGANLVSIMQLQMQNDLLNQIAANEIITDVVKIDTGRLGAQVISGIGFIGAGTILHNKGNIKGLTTAATLWLTACTGLSIGMGYYLTSGIMAVTTVLILVVLHLLQTRAQKNKGEHILEIVMKNKRAAMIFIKDYCDNHDIPITQVDYIGSADHSYMYQYTIFSSRKMSVSNIQMDLQMSEDVLSVIEIPISSNE